MANRRRLHGSKPQSQRLTTPNSTPSDPNILARTLGAFEALLNARAAIIRSARLDISTGTFIGAVSLAELAGQQALGVLALGRTSPELMLAAVPCARVAFEAGAKVAWLLQPDDVIEQHRRWMGFLSENAKLREYQVEYADKNVPDAASEMRDLAHNYRAFLADQAIRGGAPGKPLEIIRTPPLGSILSELGAGDLYITYRDASHVVHALPAVQKFLVDSRNERLQVSAVVYPSDWAEPISMASWGMYVSTLAVLGRLGGNRTHRRLLKNSYDALRRNQLMLIESALVEPMDRFMP